jgi:hypothetical protein
LKRIALFIYLIILTQFIYSQVIDELNFSWYSQADERWKYENLGYSRYNTIGKSGCVLTCLSMLFNSEASSPQVTPEELNAWLIKNNGYALSDMRWEVVVRFDGDNTGVELEGMTNKRNDWSFISHHLEKGNKVITKVGSGRGHWVLIVGKNGAYNRAASYEVNDPGLATYRKRTLAHWGGFRAARAFSGNWVTRDQLKLNNDAQIIAADSLDALMYKLYNVIDPAELYVNINNSLNAPITGYYLLGVFSQDNKFINTMGSPIKITLNEGETKDVLFTIETFENIKKSNYQIKLLYAKSLDKSGTPQNALVLNPTGFNYYTLTPENIELVIESH